MQRRLALDPAVVTPIKGEADERGGRPVETRAALRGGARVTTCMVRIS